METVLPVDLILAAIASWRVRDPVVVGICQEKEKKDLHKDILLELFCNFGLLTLEVVLEETPSNLIITTSFMQR